MMQALFADNHCLNLRDIPIPEPRSGEIRIRTHYAGINRADLMQVAGSYPPPEGVANIPGLEVSGHVDACAPEVKIWKEGDAVCALLPGGGYADYVCVPAAHCLPIPHGCDLMQAAALPECTATVWMALFAQAAVQPGERVLIHGGASGIGTTAIQMLRAHHCPVWVTVGAPWKAERCQALGATPILYRQEDFVSILRQAGSVDVVLDSIGGDYIDRNLQCLRPDGRLVSIAFLKHSNIELSAGRLLMKRLHWFGTTLRSRSEAQKAEYITCLQQQIWPLIGQGRLQPVIDSVFSLRDAAQAHEKMLKSLHCGKILLQLGDS